MRVRLALALTFAAYGAVSSLPEGYFIRLTKPGETCSFYNYRDIDSLSKCQLAFDALAYEDKEVEQIENIAHSWLPAGCFSECWSDFSGHHCRKFNTHQRKNPLQISDSVRLLCKTDKDMFVRLTEPGSTCESEHLHSIDSYHQCKEAFAVLKDVGKGMEQVANVTRRWQPKGCFSTCWSVFDGHTCRNFNNDLAGNGLGSNDQLRLLCEAPEATETTAKPQQTTRKQILSDSPTLGAQTTATTITTTTTTTTTSENPSSGDWFIRSEYCFLDYCNAYEDLRKFYCCYTQKIGHYCIKDTTCTGKADESNRCKRHLEVYGLKEQRLQDSRKHLFSQKCGGTKPIEAKFGNGHWFKQSEKCFLDYCNAYEDLRKFYCCYTQKIGHYCIKDTTCTGKPSESKGCKWHLEVYGFNEKRLQDSRRHLFSKECGGTKP